MLWFQVVEIIEKLKEMELVRIKQELDDVTPALPGKIWWVTFKRYYVRIPVLAVIFFYFLQIY